MLPGSTELQRWAGHRIPRLPGDTVPHRWTLTAFKLGRVPSMRVTSRSMLEEMELRLSTSTVRRVHQEEGAPRQADMAAGVQRTRMHRDYSRCSQSAHPTMITQWRR